MDCQSEILYASRPAFQSGDPNHQSGKKQERNTTRRSITGLAELLSGSAKAGTATMRRCSSAASCLIEVNEAIEQAACHVRYAVESRSELGRQEQEAS